MKNKSIDRTPSITFFLHLQMLHVRGGRRRPGSRSRSPEHRAAPEQTEHPQVQTRATRGTTGCRHTGLGHRHGNELGRHFIAVQTSGGDGGDIHVDGNTAILKCVLKNSQP